MAVPAGYVGFTVTQAVIFRTCVRNYRNALHAPSQRRVFQTAQNWVAAARPGFANGFSFYEFAVLLNNLNGARPVPAGHAIVARITTQKASVSPCGVPRAPTNRSYFEKFGPNPLDIHFEIRGCDSEICYKRVAEYAIIPDPAPAVVPPGGPAGEYAAIFNPTAAQTAQFNGAITLRLTWEWKYDNCNTPPRTPTATKHWFAFTAETLDPDRGGRVTSTTPGAPLIYQAN